MNQPAHLDTSDMNILPSTTENHAAALLQLFADLPEPVREGMAQGLLVGEKKGEHSFDGLFVAQDSAQVIAAIWAQVQPGKTAVIWPPAQVLGLGIEVKQLLFDAANRFLENKKVTMAQMLFQNCTEEDCQLLNNIGFEKLTDLLYLVAPVKPAADELQSNLTFEAYNDSQKQRMCQLIERTYSGSLDCPSLDGQRNMDDVITGYQATGHYSPERWFFVLRDSIDIGVLILADHPSAKQWELVYMAVVPEARGKRWGAEIVRFALHAANAGGATQVVLAVDGDNQPAQDVYVEAGFIEWDRRTVFLKTYTTSK